MADREADSVTLGQSSDDLYFPSHIGENPGTDPELWRKTPKSVLTLAITGAVVVGGASGDAETDQNAINTAITNAGVGGHVVFTPSETYITGGGHAPLSGQTWTMYGAIIKRLDEVTGTSSSAITVGPSTHNIDLGTDAAAAGFYVGLIVTISDGTNVKDEAIPPTTYDQRQHAITAIAGDVITVDNTFATSSATIGTPYTVVSVGAMTSVDTSSGTLDDVTFLGGTIDGNRANNTTLTKWQVQQELFTLNCVNFRSDNLNIINSPADAVIFGGDGTRINGIKMDTIGGAFFHASGITGNGAIVSNPVMKDGRQTIDISGHGKGAISYSLNTAKLVYENLQMDGSLYGGVGGFSGALNNESQFFNGYIKGVDGAEMLQAGGTTEAIVFDGISFEGFDNDLNDSSARSRIYVENCIGTKFIGCTFTNLYARINNAVDTYFSGNTWNNEDANTSSISGSITLVGSSSGTYIDDVINGGSRYGVFIANTASDTLVLGEINNFPYTGVRNTSTGANNVISPRSVRSGSNTLGSLPAIESTQTAACTVKDILIVDVSDLDATQPAIEMASNDGIITNNVIKHPAAGSGANDVITASGTGGYIQNNYHTTGSTITAASYTVANNYTVAS